MKRLLIVLTVSALGLGTAAGLALAAKQSPDRARGAAKIRVMIRHQMRGCHAWSVNGGAFKAKQHIAVRRGTTMVVTNVDIMPHKLVQLSGPALHILRANMNRTRPTATVTFTHNGTYRLGTKAGEDYPGMDMKTMGADYALRMVVDVS